jgi:large repetitive protein
MLIPSWLTRSRRARPQDATKRPQPFRPAVESLEVRDLMAASLAISDVAVIEGDHGTVNAVFTVTLSEPATGTVTVNYGTADGTAQASRDYDAAAGTLTFAPGETSKTIIIAVKSDTSVEAHETFFVNLSGAVNADIGDGQGLGTILNDDSPNGHNGHEHCNAHKC